VSKRRKWLIFSYFSGIDTLACSHHIDDRLPLLCELGVKPVVLSSLCARSATNYPVVRIPSVAPSGMRFEMRYVTRRRFGDSFTRRCFQIPMIIALLPGYAIESLLLNFDCTWSWYFTAIPAGIWLARSHDCELIYSTGGPQSAHIAAYYCAKATGLPWVVEYQDPIVGDWITRRQVEQRYNAYFERLIASRADAVVFMTRIALEEAEKRTPLGERGHYVYPGASPDLFSRVPAPSCDENRFVMGHFGSLGGNRNAEPVLRALKRLVEVCPEAQDRILLRIVGDMDKAQAQMLQRFPHQQMLDVYGKQPRSTSLEKMLSCNLLLLIQNASSGSTVSIPSKYYEYLHSGRPVLGLTYANSELEENLTKLGHLATDLRDEDAVFRYIHRAYMAWASKQPIAQPLESPYTTRAAAQQLLSITDKISHKYVGKKVCDSA